MFNYERSAFGQERIFSLGPTSIPVHVEVFYVENLIRIPVWNVSKLELGKFSDFDLNA